ncbi:MAG: lytic transglycosylase domain-containing protein [Rhodospirillales bacterium]|nr:lytic transglycosylase domain-containing protein [Rhodospirillales bacterium]
MRMLILAALILLSLGREATALLVSDPPAAGAGLLCRGAIAAAERAEGIPRALLAAIGRVESGRRDPASGTTHPWPWTINAEGDGQYFQSKPEAIAAVRSLQARGVRSIDVGCMQVNLMHHPNAFPALDQAFDPSTNAAYAARFLRRLFEQTGSWAKAAAAYHSSTPELGEPYQRQVMAVWPEELAAPAAGPVTGMTSPLAAAWGATRSVAPPFQRSETVRILPLARGPDAAGATGRDLAAYRAAPIPTVVPLNRPRG